MKDTALLRSLQKDFDSRLSKCTAETSVKLKAIRAVCCYFMLSCSAIRSQRSYHLYRAPFISSKVFTEIWLKQHRQKGIPMYFYWIFSRTKWVVENCEESKEMCKNKLSSSIYLYQILSYGIICLIIRSSYGTQRFGSIIWKMWMSSTYDAEKCNLN